MMTSKQKRALQRLIFQKRDAVRARFDGRHGELTGPSTKSIGDTADEAVWNDALEMQYALDENDLAELGRLDDAERRLDDADFGVCERCGEPIEMKRLLALPETSLCFSCAEEEGVGRRQYHPHPLTAELYGIV
jgi:DnaK suppressor protein